MMYTVPGVWLPVYGRALPQGSLKCSPRRTGNHEIMVGPGQQILNWNFRYKSSRTTIREGARGGDE